MGQQKSENNLYKRFFALFIHFFRRSRRIKIETLKGDICVVTLGFERKCGLPKMFGYTKKD